MKPRILRFIIVAAFSPLSIKSHGSASNPPELSPTAAPLNPLNVVFQSFKTQVRTPFVEFIGLERKRRLLLVF
ncbi:hypothetical protein CEXT_86691 [Caerostris extrusa]|uniref:Uncharacterized protein n=1 Tax=Caerostris extrusa TaxID=172846 RepID=A0AAV4XEW8_CAEEX|nr:hypothetical protein CEXT_86691 [Caerostris extrusa]